MSIIKFYAAALILVSGLLVTVSVCEEPKVEVIIGCEEIYCPFEPVCPPPPNCPWYS